MNDACLDVCGAEERVPMEGSRHIKVFFFRLEPFPLKEIPGFLFGKLDIDGIVPFGIHWSDHRGLNLDPGSPSDTLEAPRR